MEDNLNIIQMEGNLKFLVNESLAKLDSVLNQSQTVMVGETKNKQKKLRGNRAIPKHSLALVEANNATLNN